VTPKASKGWTVLIQDRSRLYRECLKLVFERSLSLQVEETVPDEEALVDAFLTARPSILVFEAVGVPWNVAAMLGRLRPAGVGVTLIGTHPSGHRNTSSLPDVAYVRRTSRSADFIEAMFGRAPLAVVGAGLGADGPSSGPDLLTPRERQVLALICGGQTIAQIAARLGISIKTVENRRHTLFAKLGVQNQSSAVVLAMRSGLLGGSPRREEAP
jgi:DNA-binding CsgD family transcriptional regulator